MGHEVVLADIIATELSLDASRVVIYDENYEPPKDQGIYIIIAYSISKIVGVSNKFDPDTDEEIQAITWYTTYNVEVTSRNTDAQDRHFEVILAITSNYALRRQEDNDIRLFRTAMVTDLSAIEGSAALHRYQIPIIISSVETKRSSILPIEKFRAVEDLENG